MKREFHALLLVALLMFQSCVVYHKSSIPIEKASITGYYKIETNYNKDYFFDKIRLKNGDYYGFSGDDKTLIDTNTITGIYAKDDLKSKKRTTTAILVSVISIPAAIIIIVIIDINNNGMDIGNIL